MSGANDDKGGGVKDGILVEAAIFGLVECWLKSVGEEKDFQQFDDFIGGGAAQNGDANRLQSLDCGKLPAQALSFQKEVVDGKLVKAHSGRLLPKFTAPSELLKCDRKRTVLSEQ